MSSSSTTSTESSSSPHPPFQSAQPHQNQPAEEELSSSSSPPGPKPVCQSEAWTSSDPTSGTDSIDSGPIETELADQASPSDDDQPTLPSPPRGQSKQSATFLRHVAAERDLAISLDKLTAQDLSIHLFNAFALKRRARSQDFVSQAVPKFRSRKGSSISHRPRETEIHLDVGSDDGESPEIGVAYEQVGDPGWRPPKVWTAWPMRAAEVPREGRKWEEDDHCASLREWSEASSCEFIKELLVARVLKVAKERYIAKETEDKLEPATSVSSESDEENLLNSSDAVSEDDSPELDSKRRMKPVIMADDECASLILQPSIQHILSSLDRLLTNLHTARASYAVPKRRRKAHGFDGATSEPTESNADYSAASSSRKRRRASLQSVKNSRVPHLDPQASSSSNEDPSSTLRSRKRQRTGSSNRSKSRPPSGANYKPPSRSQSRPKTPRPQKFGALDWSTILGMASLSNFPPNAVLRATQRCADLFDEAMKFRILHKDIRGREDETVHIKPGTPKENSHPVGRMAASETDPEDSSNLSDDEDGNAESSRYALHGGIHLDSFLQPIRGRPWWSRPIKPKQQRDPSLPKARRGRPRKPGYEERLKKTKARIPGRSRGRPRKEEWEKKVKTRDENFGTRGRGRSRGERKEEQMDEDEREDDEDEKDGAEEGLSEAGEADLEVADEDMYGVSDEN